MKVLLTVLAVVLMLPVILVVGIALGPAILVIVFIVGIAMVVLAVGWLADRARWHRSRRTRVPPLRR